MREWNNLEEMQQDHDTALRLIRQQGVVFADDPTAKEQARELFINIFVALPDVVFGSTLALIYIYDMDEQPSDIAGSDGYSSISEHQSDGRKVSSLGVSLQALQAGEDYATMILLHELAHITVNESLVTGQHGGAFHLWLDALIRQYNQCHGTDVQNDYAQDSKNRLMAGREISEADQAAVEHMRKYGTPPPSPYKKIPVTKPNRGKACREAHRR